MNEILWKSVVYGLVGVVLALGLASLVGCSHTRVYVDTDVVLVEMEVRL